MASEQLKRLIAKQNRLFNRMQDIQSQAEEAGEWSAEQRTNWDAANADIDIVSADIEREERTAKLAEVDYRQVVQTGNDGPPQGAPADTGEARAAAYESAFHAYVRGGMDGCTTEQRQLLMEHRASPQGVTVPADGGYLVPPGYRQTMTESLKAFGGLMNLANVITTSTGNPLQWPTNDDTGNTGAILSENTVITELGVTIGTKALGAYTYTSKLVRVSLQLLQDSAFDLDSWLPKKLGERIGRAVAANLVTGTGVGEPTGLLPAATNASITIASAVFTTVSAANDVLLYDALVDLEHAVDPAYRVGDCRFLFSDKILARIRKAKDTQNRPLYLPVPVPGQPATVNGNPFTIDQAMPVAAGMTTGARPILFGNFREGYIVRQVLDVQAVRLAERYADFLQVGYFGFMRLDGTVDDPGAVKVIQTTS